MVSKIGIALTGLGLGAIAVSKLLPPITIPNGATRERQRAIYFNIGLITLGTGLISLLKK